MRKSIYLWIIAGSVLAACGNGGEIYSPAIEEDSVKKVVNDAVSWQLDNMPLTGRAVYNPQYTGWADGVFFSAVAEWSETDDSRGFRSRLREIGESTRYEPAPKTLNPANDIAVSMMYMSLYLDERKPKYLIDTISDYQKQLDVLRGGWTEIIPTIERLDYQMKYCPRTDNLDFNVARNHERWCWCDALYMAAPTYALLSVLKEEYRHAFIGGAMFRLDRQHIQVEAGAVWNGGAVISRKSGLDVRSLDASLYNELEETVDYNAWWYSVVPMENVRADNLPLPVFIRGDDAEYGLRNTKKLILMNGICVWHEPFENKYSSSMYYYIFRNRLIDNSVRGINYTKNQLLRELKEHVYNELFCLRYKNVDLLLRGIEDYFRGIDWLKAQDGEKLHKKVIL